MTPPPAKANLARFLHTLNLDIGRKSLGPKNLRVVLTPQEMLIQRPASALRPGTESILPGEMNPAIKGFVAQRQAAFHFGAIDGEQKCSCSVLTLQGVLVCVVFEFGSAHDNLLSVHYFAGCNGEEPCFAGCFGEVVHVQFVVARAVFHHACRIAAPDARDLRLRALSGVFAGGRLCETKESREGREQDYEDEFSNDCNIHNHLLSVLSP